MELSQQYISGLENGRRNPMIVMLYEFANALDVSHVKLVAPIKSTHNVAEGKSLTATVIVSPKCNRYFSR
jgi:transcriptional regulator with XRE-family HTH domain